MTAGERSLRAAGQAMGFARLLLVAFLWLLAATGGAGAHAVVTGTDPADGAVLEEPAAQVAIRFSEPVSLIRAQVLGPQGDDVLAPDAARAEEGGLVLDLPPSLPDGTYTVSYRVVSLDGHPVGGSLVFSLGAASGAAAQPGEASEPGGWRRALVASWTVFYLTVLGAAGGVIYTLVLRPGEPSARPARRIVAVAALLGILASVAAVGIQGALLLDGPSAALLDPRAWEEGARSTFGRAALCAVAGLALILLGGRAGAASKVLGAAGLLLVLASFVLTGHVVTAGPRWMTWPLLLAHVAAAAFWIGSLLPLHRALRAPEGHALALVQRFSRLALVLVPALLVAGVLIAVLQVRSPAALPATGYGRLLLVKVALVAALLMLAALNRLRLTPALARGETRAPARLGGSILAELGLVAAILAVTAALGTTPPPRALAQERGLDPHDRHAHEEHGHAHDAVTVRMEAGNLRAELTLVPGGVGANAATLSLSGPDGSPLEVMEVTVLVSNPGKGIEPLERVAERLDVGLWEVEDLVLGTAGEWLVELDVLVSDFERSTAQATLALD